MPKSPRQRDTAFAIVLFTDMVGSTAIASELGDRRWKLLQAKHHSVIRAQLREHGGREIDTAGDGFFAAFAEGDAAIRCACAIRDAVMDIGLQVRCGLNVGQVETNDQKPTGAAVVAAARIMTKAGDGEVLVSNLLRELIPGSTIKFADAGVHELKGLEGSWHLFSVVAVDGAPLAAAPPAEELVARRTSIAESKGVDESSVSRPMKILAGATALLILAAGIAFLGGRDDASVSTITPNSIGIIDLESGEVIETIGLEERPGSVAASTGAVWVANPDAGTVTRIDPTDEEVRDSISVGENPTGIAVGFGAVWVVESGGPSVSRISPDTNAVVGDPIRVGNGPAGIAVGEGSVWVTNRLDGTISRIDPADGTVEAIPVGLDPRGIAVGFGSVWVGLSGSNTVARVDPRTNSVTPIGVGNGPGSLAVSGGSVWVANTLDDTVFEIDPVDGRVVDLVEVGDGPSGLAVVDGSVWVANEADGSLSRIDAGDSPLRTMAIGSVPEGLVGVNEHLWVSVRGTATSHRGGTLRLVSHARNLDLDPGGSYDPWGWKLLHLIGDGLLAFEPVGGAGIQLVPDLATSIPPPVNGGRTYIFELRQGIRYSNGEVVAPGDFRRALERGFPLYPSVHADLYGGLVGGSACEESPRNCDLRAGVVADEATNTITFNLIEPDPEFRYKLTLPFAYPAPPSAPDRYQAREGIPGTGPYMLQGPMTKEGVSLIRNPHFRVWSPVAQPDGFVDRIEWAFGVDPQAQVEAVVAGDADVAFQASDSGSLDEILVRFAAQVHTNPAAATYYIVLDTTSPPFDQVEVRRALNLALDRDVIVQANGGDAAAIPTCQQIPPNFQGYEPYCPYTSSLGPKGSGVWSGPDMERAQDLIDRSGTAGMRVVLEYPPAQTGPSGARVGDYLTELLNELGYRGGATPVPVTQFYSPRNDFQMALAGFFADYPAASTFVDGKLTCGSTFTPTSGFCDARIESMIDRANEMQDRDPASSGALWAAIDRAFVDQAPYLWLVNPIAVEFVSERVGNYQWNLQWGGLLNQLWVR